MWSRSGGSITKSQIGNGNRGTELRFTNPIENDASIYKCTDTVNEESKTLNITDGKYLELLFTSEIWGWNSLFLSFSLSLSLTLTLTLFLCMLCV